MKQLLLTLSALALLAPQVASAAACASLTDHLAAYYDLDGNSNDAVNTNNGVDTSMSYSTTNAVVNQAGQFNGSNSRILIPSSSSFTSPTTGLSLVGWFYITGTVTGTIIGKAPATAPNGTYVRLDVNGAKLNGTIDGDATIAINGGTTLSANTRYMAALTYDGATVSLWLWNGTTLAKDAADQSTGISTTPGTGSVGIGELGDFGGQYIGAGALDAVGYWTCGLTNAQLTTLVNANAGLQYPFIVSNPAKFTGFWHVF